MDARDRKNVRLGARVQVIRKADQATGELTQGVVARILTKSKHHPHGIKVMLEDGQVGRVQRIENAPPEGTGGENEEESP
jgi:uncharacterized repeat protein (TIGR03833 family)